MSDSVLKDEIFVEYLNSKGVKGARFIVNGKGIEFSASIVENVGNPSFRHFILIRILAEHFKLDQLSEKALEELTE